MPGGGFGGFGGDDGDDGFARGRKFSSDDLQLLLLDLINAEPSYGYELIKALQTRSNGFYSPSPGMIYPALTYLEELGYAVVQLEANRKCYSLADEGREYLTANRERVEQLNAKLEHIAQRVDMMRRAMAGEEPLDPNAGGWLPEFSAARHALRTAVHQVEGADEQRRVTAIMVKATAEILAGQTNAPDENAKK
jgi:DNA-binding PadR family transcriptional regulator